MDEHELLMAYSEWLDADQHLLKPEDEEDERSHDELVTAFLAERAEDDE